MLTVLLILLTVACVVLTVTFLGALRTLVSVRLLVKGYGGAGTAAMRIDYGQRLPDGLLASFPRADGDGLVAFLSGDCERCWDLAKEIDRFRECPVVACVIGGADGEDGLRARLGPTVSVVPGPVATDVADEMRIDATPVVLIHRDGYIVSSAIGSGVQSAQDIERLWAAFGKTTNGGGRNGR